MTDRYPIYYSRKELLYECIAINSSSLHILMLISMAVSDEEGTISQQCRLKDLAGTRFSSSDVTFICCRFPNGIKFGKHFPGSCLL